MWVGGALILQLLAIGLWRKADINDAKKRKIILFWAGQFLLTASLALLICHMGAGLGLSWGLLLLSFAVWPYFLWPLLSARQIGRSRESRKIQRELGKSKASNGSKWFLALRLFSAGPLYLFAAMALGIICATQLPWLEVNRLMLGGMLIPFIWAAGALHATAETKWWRLLLIPIAITLLSIALYFSR